MYNDRPAFPLARASYWGSILYLSEPLTDEERVVQLDGQLEPGRVALSLAAIPRCLFQTPNSSRNNGRISRDSDQQRRGAPDPEQLGCVRVRRSVDPAFVQQAVNCATDRIVELVIQRHIHSCYIRVDFSLAIGKAGWRLRTWFPRFQPHTRPIASI